jgi:hypothetical protein
MFLIFLLLTQVFCGICAQNYIDRNGSIPQVGGSLTWAHSPSMGAYRIRVFAPADSLIRTQCNIFANCQTQSFIVSRSGELDLNKDGRSYCGSNVTLPTILSIGNEIVVALNAKAYEGATFKCVFQSIAQTNTNCQCGWSKSSRIIGGMVSSANEFVSHAGFVNIPVSGGIDIFCGGVISKDCLIDY